MFRSSSAVTTPDPLAHTEDPIRVLLVDDEPEFASTAATFLEREDPSIQVVPVETADDGLDVLATGDIDCVISDYDLPEVDGLVFLESVRASHPDLPFILFTGSGSEAVASEAISAGVTDYLQKEPGVDQYPVLAHRIKNLVAQHRAETSLETTRHRYQRLIEESWDVFAVIDTHGCFEYLSPSVDRVLGYRADELLGDIVYDYVHPEDREDVLAELDALMADPSRQTVTEFRFEDREGSWRWIEARGRNLLMDPVIGGIVVYTRDVTERKHRERLLERLHQATRILLRAETKQEAADAIGEAAATVLGYSNNVVRLLSEDGSRLVPVTVVSEDLPAGVENRPVYEVGEETAGLAFERREPIVYDDVGELVDEKERHGARAGVYLPIGEHGVLTITEFEPGVFDETDVQLASILTANAAIAFDRIAHQREQEARVETLTELNAATTRLFRANTPEAICEVTAEAARDILGYPNTVVRLVDEDRGVLVPVAVTERAHEELGDRPDYPIGEGTAGRAYAMQDALLVEDAAALDDGYPRGDGRGAMYLPIGEHGTISIADTKPGRFDQSDVELARLLTAAAEAALFRVEQQETLEQQHDRLEMFTRILAHDLRNPLNLVLGRLELAQLDVGENEHLVTAVEGAERMRDLIEQAVALAKAEQAEPGDDRVSIRELVEECWAHLETGGADLRVAGDPVVTGDRDLVRRLVENLLVNAVEHGDPDGTVWIGTLRPQSGFYVADDGPGIPADEREAVFDRGFTTSAAGSGLGLAIVREIAEAHNWVVRVTWSRVGGARFEIVTG